MPRRIFRRTAVGVEIAAVDSERNLVDLRSKPQVAAGDGIAGVERHIGRAHHAFDDGLIVGDNIQDRTDALGILASARVGNNLHFAYARGRNCLEYVLGVVGK